MIFAWGITDTGTVRQQNQDAFGFQIPGDNCAFGVVCDGMGGAQAGNVASRLGVEHFMREMEGQGSGQLAAAPREALEAAVGKANDAVFSMAGTQADCQGMGTTLVAALLLEGEAHILNIGDSRAYLAGPSGIRQLTRDHSVVGDLVSRGELTPEEARQHPQKNLITRAVGTDRHAQTDYYAQKIGEGEYLLLCSDGLTNVVSDQEILYEILHGEGASGCCGRLLDIALSRGAPDNVTALLFQL